LGLPLVGNLEKRLLLVQLGRDFSSPVDLFDDFLLLVVRLCLKFC